MFSGVFQSPFEWCGEVACAELNGKPFMVVREITEPTEDYGGIDAEVLPMYRIAIEGREITAWPEEVLVD